MKKIFLNTILFLSILSCKAQSPVYSLFTEYGSVANAYYKDMDNDFNKFEGTWLYTNGNTSLKIVFVKRIMHHDTHLNFYTDMLVGEYEYIENGVLKANTLTNLNNTSLNLYNNTFSGDFIVPCKYGGPGGNECAIGERRIKLSYKEQDRKYLNQYVVLRQYSDQFGVYIKLIHFSQMSIAPDTGPILGPTLPQGTYILTKQ